MRKWRDPNVLNTSGGITATLKSSMSNFQRNFMFLPSSLRLPAKPVDLVGPVTGLKHRHSTGLQGPFQALDQTLDKFQGLLAVVVQGDAKNLLNFGGIQFNANFF